MAWGNSPIETLLSHKQLFLSLSLIWENTEIEGISVSLREIILGTGPVKRIVRIMNVEI